MMKNFCKIFLLLFFGCFLNGQSIKSKIHTIDLDNFWKAYDFIQSESDSTKHLKIIQNEFFQNGTIGLKTIRQVRNYSEKEYLDAIRKYPKFWNSIRKNTEKSKSFSVKLNAGIEKLRKIYPELRPAEIYFEMGVFRTSGTTLDSLILIGAELAMGDSHTDLSEFSTAFQERFRNYYASNPVDNLVLLNIHEYVHTQQKPMVHNLLCLTLYEGIAEFVSVQAMKTPSSSPAIEFGKKNVEKVRVKFEKDLFRVDKTNDWLWNDANNELGIRDLGYFVGYEMAERFYKNSTDKRLAIKKLIELDYSNDKEIESFVDGTQFLSAPLNKIYAEFEENRPSIISTTPDLNELENIDASTTKITLHFSEPMNKETRGFELGPLGEEALLMVQKVIGYSDDGKSFTFEVKMEKGKLYQINPSNRFLSQKGFPLKYHLIEFKTAN